MMEQTMLENRVLGALREVLDPEIGLDVVELGLIDGLRVGDDAVALTLIPTSPACPLADMMRRSCEDAIRRAAPEAATVEVRIGHDRRWSPDRMSADARRRLGWG